MLAVITFVPIATQLARLVPLDEIVPSDAVEVVTRDHREQARRSDEAKLPDDVRIFFAHYMVVTRGAVQFLGAPGFEKLARFHEEIEDRYMPGGPPMSPVYDSFAMQFVLGSLPQGMGNKASEDDWREHCRSSLPSSSCEPTYRCRSS